MSQASKQAGSLTDKTKAFLAHRILSLSLRARLAQHTHYRHASSARPTAPRARLKDDAEQVGLQIEGWREDGRSGRLRPRVEVSRAAVRQARLQQERRRSGETRPAKEACGGRRRNRRAFPDFQRALEPRPERQNQGASALVLFRSLSPVFLFPLTFNLLFPRSSASEAVEETR